MKKNLLFTTALVAMGFASVASAAYLDVPKGTDDYDLRGIKNTSTFTISEDGVATINKVTLRNERGRTASLNTDDITKIGITTTGSTNAVFVQKLSGLNLGGANTSDISIETVKSIPLSVLSSSSVNLSANHDINIENNGLWKVVRLESTDNGTSASTINFTAGNDIKVINGGHGADAAIANVGGIAQLTAGNDITIEGGDAGVSTTSVSGIEGTTTLLSAGNIKITGTKYAVNSYAKTNDVGPSTTNIKADGDVDIEGVSYGVQADGYGSTVNIEGKNVTVTSEESGAVLVGNKTTDATSDFATVNITADKINLLSTGENGYGVGAMSQGIVNINGDTTIEATDALLGRGDATININADGKHTTVLKGNIALDYDAATSGTGVDANINAVLAGEQSSWTGNTIIKYDTKPDDEKLAVSSVSVTLQDGATWTATQIDDNTAEDNGSYYTALNNLTIDKGSVEICDASHGITVDNATLSDAAFNGGTLTVNNSMDVKNTLTLNNTGIAGDGTVSFADGTTLNIKQGTTIANAVTSAGTTLNVEFDTGVTQLDLNDIFTTSGNSVAENITLAGNSLYNLTANDSKTIYTVSQKSAEEVATSLGVSSNEASAVLAAISADSAKSTNENFTAIAEKLNTAAQNGEAATVKEASKLGADAAPVVTASESQFQTALFGVVTNQLDNAGGAMAQGQASGDVFHKMSAWVRGFFTDASKDKTSKSASFDADTYGVAFGVDKELDNNVKAGVGYAYGSTDIKGDGRKTDVDTNTLFVYGKYQPNQWYLNSLLAYSWSDYDEKKSVLGIDAGGKYDVDTISLQAMLGYETQSAGYDITPEFGFRYLHIEQDGYTNNLGTKVDSHDADILTGVLGAKLAKSYELDNGYIIRPELNAAVTYDIATDDNNAVVTLANGAAYQVKGDKLDRLGFELGAKVTAYSNANWDVVAGYTAKLRDDYNDNTYMLEAKYNF